MLIDNDNDNSCQDPRVSALARRLHEAGARSLLVLGRGYSYATCLEGALKIKELTYLHRCHYILELSTNLREV